MGEHVVASIRRAKRIPRLFGKLQLFLHKRFTLLLILKDVGQRGTGV